MKKIYAAVIAAALALPCFIAQAQTPTGDKQPSPQNSAAESGPDSAAIPPAEQPGKEQLAKLFEVMHLRDQMQNLMRMIPALVSQQVQSQMGQIMEKLAPGAQLTDEQQAKLRDLMSKYISKAMTVYTIDDMIADMTTVYQHHISRTDVDALIAFYSSPAGQHLLNAQPAIMKEYMPIVMQRQQNTIGELTDEMQRDLEDFTKSLSTGQSTPTPK
jgi:uncharacterized protein